MNVINATTYARTGVAIGGGTGSFELSLVTSGVQAGLLVGTVNIGVFGFNKSTNTLAYGPTTAFSSPTIKYIPTLNKIIPITKRNFIKIKTFELHLQVQEKIWSILSKYDNSLSSFCDFKCNSRKINKI